MTIRILSLTFTAATLISCSSNIASSTSVPALSSKTLKQAWGSPKTTKSPAGNPVSIYQNPQNDRERFEIERSSNLLGSPNYPPHIVQMELKNGRYQKTRSVPQLWQTTEALGKKIRWYQVSFRDDQDAPIFRSEDFQLTSSSGVKGYYRVESEGSAKDFENRLKSLSWP